MNRSIYQGILRFITIFSFELSALVVAGQAVSYARSGAWSWISPGDIFVRLGVGPLPPEWMGGSVYDMLWNEPLALTTLVIGLLAMTYAGIAQYEGEEDAPRWARP